MSSALISFIRRKEDLHTYTYIYIVYIPTDTSNTFRQLTSVCHCAWTRLRISYRRLDSVRDSPGWNCTNITPNLALHGFQKKSHVVTKTKEEREPSVPLRMDGRAQRAEARLRAAHGG